MRKTKQFSFVDLRISSLIPPNDPLKALFEQVDFSFIYTLLKDTCSSAGPQGYDPQSLFKALLLIYLGFASSERDLARKLRFDGRLAFLCGFSYGGTPKHNTFHYFRGRLGTETFQHILTNLIAQALCIVKVTNLSLSIDSSHIEAHPNDPEAHWGYKSQDFSFFGYKIHLEVTNTELPIPVSVHITPGNEWDGKLLAPLTDDAKRRLTTEGKKITALVADPGYDSTENAAYLLGEDITPYIAENPRGRENPIHRGDITISADGTFLCTAGVKLCFWGREKKRKRIKFRCGLYKQGAAGCLFRGVCWGGTYGPAFYLKEDQRALDVLKALRTSSSFKRNYKKRTVIERFFGTLKGNHSLEEVRFRGIRELSMHVIMSICAYLSRLIAGMKLKIGLLPV